MPTLRVIVFSKDRPFQVRECLRTFGVPIRVELPESFRSPDLWPQPLPNYSATSNGRNSDPHVLCHEEEGASAACVGPTGSAVHSKTGAHVLSSAGPVAPARPVDSDHSSFASGDVSIISQAALAVEVVVIAKTSTPEFREAYEMVADWFRCKAAPDPSCAAAADRSAIHWGAVQFVFESDATSDGEQNFAVCLQQAVTAPHAASSGAADYIMFMVDDGVWVHPPPLAEAATILLKNNDVFCYQCRMHPHISFSHPATEYAPQPPLFMFGAQDVWASSLGWYFRDGTSDWCYPWDLSATIYRLEDVQAAFDTIHISEWNPNTLECSLNRLWTEATSPPRSAAACPAQAHVLIVTVNRVQTTYETPVFQPTGIECASFWNTATQITIATDTNIAFDVRHYATRCYSAAHIGDWRISSGKGSVSALVLPLISVILPIHNGKSFLLASVASILQQTYPCVELICVDDGSTDGSLELLLDIKRDSGLCDDKFHIIRLPSREGIAKALNAALMACSGDYIARMDADDVAHPTRLLKQYAYLQDHPSIDIVGTAVQIEDLRLPTSDRGVVVTNPTDIRLVAWSSFFFNPIAHSTAMFRRKTVDKLLPADSSHLYRSDKVPAEDYDLWLRALWVAAPPLQAGNLGQPLLRLRRHPHNASRDVGLRESKRLHCFVEAFAGMHNELVGQLLRDASVPASVPAGVSQAHVASIVRSLANFCEEFVVKYLDRVVIDDNGWEQTAVRNFVYMDSVARACGLLTQLSKLAPRLILGNAAACSELKALLQTADAHCPTKYRAKIAEFQRNPVISMLLRDFKTKLPNALVADFLA